MRSHQPSGRSKPIAALGQPLAATRHGQPRHGLAHLDANRSLDVHAVIYALRGPASPTRFRQMKTDHR